MQVDPDGLALIVAVSGLIGFAIGWCGGAVDAIQRRREFDAQQRTCGVTAAPASASNAAHVGPPDWLRLAQECGGTVYRHRSDPTAPGVAFGDESWARFTASLSAVLASGVEVLPPGAEPSPEGFGKVDLTGIKRGPVRTPVAVKRGPVRTPGVTPAPESKESDRA